MAYKVDYSGKSVEQILAAVREVNPDTWRNVGRVWGSMGTGIRDAQGVLDGAWRNTPVWQKNDGDPEAVAFNEFRTKVDDSQISASEWGNFGSAVGDQLTGRAQLIGVFRNIIEQTAQIYNESRADLIAAAGQGEDALYKTAKTRMDYARDLVVKGANLLGEIILSTFDGVDVPKAQYKGPMKKAGDGQPNAGDPNAGDPNAGNGAGNGGGGNGVGGPGDDKETSKQEEKKPETKDPLDEASEYLDLAGKAIDLLGKPADVASKYLDLASKLKDLFGGTGQTDPSLQNPDLKDLLPKDLVPRDWYLDPKDLTPKDPLEFPDRPSLAGGLTTEPTLPSLSGSSGGSTGAAGTAIPAIGSAVGLGAAGAARGEPSVGARMTAGTTQPAASSPMYPPMQPPMGGMGGAGAGGQGQVKPGAAPHRPFSAPAEQTEAERLRRNGVQSDLQGRTNGEQQSAPVRPIRKRKPAAPMPNQEVLDEELWRV